LNFKSTFPDNFDAIAKGFKDVQKQMKQKELEGNISRPVISSEGEGLQLLRPAVLLRDLNMRPTFGSGSRRTIVNLEGHANGFRVSVKNSIEKLEVLYSQVKHAVFEPCEKTLIVLLHLHLWEPIMIGKKRTQDLQFFTEVADQTEDLSKSRAGNAADPDEIFEEQRDREVKDKLNKVFKDFAGKIENIETCTLKWDIPFVEEMSFMGVPNKESTRISLGVNAMYGLQSWPPFVVSADDIDVVVFERAAVSNLREFDMSIVNKNYSEMPVRVCTIARKTDDMLKTWLIEKKVVWYASRLNMAWVEVMDHIRKDPDGFVENGGWDAWFNVANSADEESDEKDAEDWDDEDSDDDAGESDVSEASVEEEDDPDDSEETGGMSWDELEEEADRQDRRKDAERRGKVEAPTRQPSTRAAKRARR